MKSKISTGNQRDKNPDASNTALTARPMNSGLTGGVSTVENSTATAVETTIESNAQRGETHFGRNTASVKGRNIPPPRSAMEI